MACRTTLPAASSFSEGRVVGLASAFCTPWTSSSFAALPRHPPSGRAAATPSLAVGSGSLLGTRRGRSYSRRRRSEPLRCGLTRLSGDAGHRVLPVLATRDQWSHYWGGSDVQRVGKFFEVTAVAFLGLWACYFASFFLGVATMTVIGTSFLFYWLLAPNVTSFRRNRALRGRIAPYPGADGNSVAIFRARVASATEEYHPVTGQPVFLRMVIEDEDGRALKFRTRTRAEYARVRPGMVAEAILVSPDERFEEILGVSDTFIPAANVWVGEYPYLDKVVMRRLLASRDSKRRRRRRNGAEGDPQGYGEEEDDELNPMTYRDSWTQTRPDGPSATGAAAGERDIAGGLPPPHLTEKFGVASVSSDFDTLYGEGGSLDDEPYFEGVGSAGFSEVDGSAAGRPRGRQQWERVSGRPRPRRRPPAAAARSSREDEGERWGGRRVRGEASFGREWESEEYGGTTLFGGERSDDSRMATGRKRRL